MTSATRLLAAPHDLLGQARRDVSADRWTLGFYKYSDEKCELCFVDEAGGFERTPEQGLAVAANVYLQGG